MKPNILLITIDSLRADHLGCYGYRYNTSPHLDALAAQGVRFNRAIAPGIPTMPSFTTLHTGLHPLRHGITAHASEQRLPPDVKTLAQMANATGYTTVAIDNLATQAHGRGSWFARGFDYYSSFLYQPFSAQCEELTERALSYIEQLQTQPWLLWIHFWDPHSPYGPPAPYDTLHYQRDESVKIETVIERAPEYYREFLSDMKLKRPDDYAYIVAQYDGEISYVDSQVGRLCERLKSLNLYDSSHVIALSDHGEAFGEDEIYFDHHGLSDAVIRVPLLWKPPASTCSEVCDAQVCDAQVCDAQVCDAQVCDAQVCDAMISTEDVLPTLIECCDLKSPEYELTGQSFAPVLRGENFAGRQEIVCIESTRQATMALRTRDWKLIVPLTQTGDGRALPDIYGQPRAPQMQLFDLKTDPNETRDVSHHHPEVCETLLQVLAEKRNEENARRNGADPLDLGLSLDYADFMARLTSRKLRG